MKKTYIILSILMVSILLTSFVSAEQTAFWGLNEGTGSLIYNDATISYDGEIINSVPFSTGVDNYSLNFTSSSGHFVNLTGGTGSSNPYLNDDAYWSMGGWIYHTGSGDDTIFSLQYKSGKNSGLWLWLDGNDLKVFRGSDTSGDTFITDSSSYPSDQKRPRLNTWEHFTVVQTGTTLNVYFNGELYDSGQLDDDAIYWDSGIPADLTYQNHIGSDGYARAYKWDGLMDNMFIYDNALSTTEVLNIFNEVSSDKETPWMVTGAYDQVTDSSARVFGTLNSLGDYSSVDSYFLYKKVGEVLYSESQSISLSSVGQRYEVLTGLSEGINYTYKYCGQYDSNVVITCGVDGYFRTSGDNEPIIRTLYPEHISNTSVRLNGLVELLNGNVEVDAYFKYKNSTASTFSETSPSTITTDNTYLDHPVSSLTAGEEYTFKFCVDFDVYTVCDDPVSFNSNDINVPYITFLDIEEIDFNSAILKNFIYVGDYDEVTLNIEYKEHGATEYQNQEYTLTSSKTTSYTADDLKSDTLYQYRVRINYDAGDYTGSGVAESGSSSSDILEFTTLESTASGSTGGANQEVPDFFKGIQNNVKPIMGFVLVIGIMVGLVMSGIKEPLIIILAGVMGVIVGSFMGLFTSTVLIILLITLFVIGLLGVAGVGKREG